MVHHLLRRRATETTTPDFPERADLPYLTDREALAALDLLRLLVTSGAADVYTQPVTLPGERPRWNVWLGSAITPGGKRIALGVWAASCFERPTPPDAA